MDAIEFEIKAKDEGCWVLYRGSELIEDKERLNKDNKPNSLHEFFRVFKDNIFEIEP